MTTSEVNELGVTRAVLIRFENSKRNLDQAIRRLTKNQSGEQRMRLENGWNNFTGSVVRHEPAKPEGVPKQ